MIHTLVEYPIRMVLRPCLVRLWISENLLRKIGSTSWADFDFLQQILRNRSKVRLYVYFPVALWWNPAAKSFEASLFGGIPVWFDCGFPKSD